jgi:hypothetical protein
MTNLLALIELAILRRSRIDHVLSLAMPTAVEVSDLVNSLLDLVPKDERLKLEGIIIFLSSKTLPDSICLIRKAARLPAMDGRMRIEQRRLDQAWRVKASPGRPNEIPWDSLETSQPLRGRASLHPTSSVVGQPRTVPPQFHVSVWAQAYGLFIQYEA